MSKDPECRAILMAETDAAICVTKDRFVEAKFWVPRSQIGYLRKTARADGGVDIVFTVPEWLIEKKEMWDLVP